MAHDDAPFLRLQLPRHDVGVMLHVGDQHLVALLHKRCTEGLCHEIDALSCSTGEDHLTRLPGIDEAAHLLTGSLVQVGGLLRQVMNAAMHIGIHVQIFFAHRIEHAERLLRCCRIIKINQRLIIYFPRQDGKVFTNLI